MLVVTNPTVERAEEGITFSQIMVYYINAQSARRPMAADQGWPPYCNPASRRQCAAFITHPYRDEPFTRASDL